MKKTLELLDLSGVAQGEVINAYDRVTTIPLNAPRVTRYRVRLDHPLATQILSLEAIMRVKNGTTLIGTLPMLSAEELASGDGGFIQCYAADPLVTRLQDRLIGKGVVSGDPLITQGIGKGVGYTQGTPLAPVDVGSIAKGVVDVTNAADGFTGVQTNPAWVTATTNKAVGPWYYKPISEVILELSAPLDGYDFELKPVNPVDVGLTYPKLAELWIYAYKGTTKPDVIFEYGTGKANVASYSRPRTLAGLCNRAYTLPDGYPDSAMQTFAGTPNATTKIVYGDTYQTVIASNLDASASITKWGVHEAVVSGDLGVDLFRLALANEHVRIRRNPREQIMFTLTSNIEYAYGVDYVEGDIVTCRAKIDGSVRFDALFRIYGVELTDDNEGNERVTLTLVPS